MSRSRPSSALARAARSLGERIAATDALDLALRLTLLDLLFQPVGDWTLRPFVLVLAGAGLLIPGWLRRPPLWLGLVLLTGLRVILDWPLPDNHAYLLAYWCLAVFLSLLTRDPAQGLAFDGRWLVGLAFAFATLWKLGSPDYLDGTFFRVTFLVDPRFESFSRLVGGMTLEHVEALRAALERHADGTGAALSGIELPRRLLLAERFVTFWTVAIEGAVAVAFLWPLKRGPARLRHALLLVFCATTYAVATVAGFAWLLLAMGVAQCEREQRITRALYVAVFFLVLLHRELPWLRLVADALAPGG